MTRSSPLRRSQVLSSPDRPFRSSFLLDDRNNELNHRDALAAAQLEHDRVREAAIRVYELHELKEEHNRIVAEEKREQERLQAEAQVVAEEKKLRELRAKTVPKLPPEPKPPVPEPPKAVDAKPPSSSQGVSTSFPFKDPAQVSVSPVALKSPPPSSTPQSNGVLGQNKSTPGGTPFGSPAQLAPGTAISAAKPSPFQTLKQPTSVPAAASIPSKPTAQPQIQATSQTQPTANVTSERYLHIHKALKKLRVDLQTQSKIPGSPLKGKMGVYRREIRVSIGQLTTGKGANVKPTKKIINALNEALQGVVPSPAIDVSQFVLESRQPAEGASNNDASLPALFIYLMNICAKAIISQFINECGANPKAAEPIGIFTAHIFSSPEFLWRGESLIDIIMAKFRVVCPVLFGLRGSDKTERGRMALGWRKDGPSYITEQSHNDRMAGLGAGFASVSLRDFGKSSKTNPYPPTHYWIALARIINCPANETSNTQYVVVRAMIEGHEQRFLNFYGNAAMAALRIALVEFPKKAPQNASAAGSLLALAEVLKAEGGMALA